MILPVLDEAEALPGVLSAFPSGYSPLVVDNGSNDASAVVAMDGQRYGVFLSHNSLDKPAVERIARELKRAGLEPWLDTWCLTKGGRWHRGFRVAGTGLQLCMHLTGIRLLDLLSRGLRPELPIPAQDPYRA